MVCDADEHLKLADGRVVSVLELLRGMQVAMANGVTGTIIANPERRYAIPVPPFPVNDNLWTSRVIGHVKHSARELVEFRCGGEIIQATPGHEVWSADRRGWISSHELHEGERVRVMENEVAPVEGMKRLAGQSVVFGIEVEYFHNYFIGKSSKFMLVHNGPTCLPKPVWADKGDDGPEQSASEMMYPVPDELDNEGGMTDCDRKPDAQVNSKSLQKTADKLAQDRVVPDKEPEDTHPVNFIDEGVGGGGPEMPEKEDQSETQLIFARDARGVITMRSTRKNDTSLIMTTQKEAFLKAFRDAIARLEKALIELREFDEERIRNRLLIHDPQGNPARSLQDMPSSGVKKGDLLYSDRELALLLDGGNRTRLIQVIESVLKDLDNGEFRIDYFYDVNILRRSRMTNWGESTPMFTPESIVGFPLTITVRGKILFGKHINGEPKYAEDTWAGLIIHEIGRKYGDMTEEGATKASMKHISVWDNIIKWLNTADNLRPSPIDWSKAKIEDSFARRRREEREAQERSKNYWEEVQKTPDYQSWEAWRKVYKQLAWVSSWGLSVSVYPGPGRWATPEQVQQMKSAAEKKVA